MRFGFFSTFPPDSKVVPPKDDYSKMAKKTATTITAPAAWIVNSNDRGRKSIKKGKVYLQDKEEFQNFL